ncbi:MULTISPECIES: NUDIX domain-containing protein [Gimesia]|uniref:RNA pyrophosphohydrolase n=1 Tax=Gimesia chilikensis TaxID=2605989 RepID=A0A517PIJ3_9PLAN|nr:NUDIX domain-containing protein [Gimesia chilikensis]QDT19169.1 RNA pyrophosphohydrolase [Gimesia chilikensis]
MTDITLDLNNYRVNLRVAAIVRREDEVLLCRPVDRQWWYLPGGRIKTNEDSLTAMHRELTEEIGPGFEVLRPVIAAENFFELEGRNFHELSTYYEVAWHGEELAGTEENELEVFEWCPLSKISGLTLKPDFVIPRILEPRTELELIVHRENQ